MPLAGSLPAVGIPEPVGISGLSVFPGCRYSSAINISLHQRWFFLDIRLEAGEYIAVSVGAAAGISWDARLGFPPRSRVGSFP